MILFVWLINHSWMTDKFGWGAISLFSCGPFFPFGSKRLQIWMVNAMKHLQDEHCGRCRDRQSNYCLCASSFGPQEFRDDTKISKTNLLKVIMLPTAHQRGHKPIGHTVTESRSTYNGTYPKYCRRTYNNDLGVRCTPFKLQDDLTFLDVLPQ